jgi:hypothetical protein
MEMQRLEMMMSSCAAGVGAPDHALLPLLGVSSGDLVVGGLEIIHDSLKRMDAAVSSVIQQGTLLADLSGIMRFMEILLLHQNVTSSSSPPPATLFTAMHRREFSRITLLVEKLIAKNSIRVSVACGALLRRCDRKECGTPQQTEERRITLELWDICHRNELAAMQRYVERVTSAISRGLSPSIVDREDADAYGFSVTPAVPHRLPVASVAEETAAAVLSRLHEELQLRDQVVIKLLVDPWPAVSDGKLQRIVRDKLAAHVSHLARDSNVLKGHVGLWMTSEMTKVRVVSFSCIKMLLKISSNVALLLGRLLSPEVISQVPSSGRHFHLWNLFVRCHDFVRMATILYGEVFVVRQEQGMDMQSLDAMGSFGFRF